MFLKTKSLLKTQIIVNPQSDKGRTGKKWKEIKAGLKSALSEFKYEFTEKPFHAAELSRAAIKDGTELIVGVGGDGTMNEIANGFYENRKAINPETILGIVPSGTGSDFSRSLYIPSSFKKAMQIITDGPNAVIDTGSARFKSQDGKEQERYFLNIGDFGIGGEVVRSVNQNRQKRKTSSYLRCMVSTFFSYTQKKLRIHIDDEQIPDDDYLIGAIANGRIFGKGMKFAPQARVDDGLFDIVLVKGMKALEFFKNAWRIYNGSHLSHPKISLYRGLRVDVQALDKDQDVLIELDGEQLGTLPASFELIPRNIVVKGYI